MSAFNTKRTVLFAGTTSSGSSALFDYFRCFENTLAVVSELKDLVREGFYKTWQSGSFKETPEYKKQFTSYINTFLDSEYALDRRELTLLLNNVVSCLTLRAVELFDTDIKIFCVIRDPRSTWLRRKYLLQLENKEIPVEQFIEEFKNQRELFEYNYCSLRKYQDKISIVSFEDFMLDTKYKESIIKEAGFNILDYPKKPQYTPWSIKETILRHQFYDKQAEIDLIYKELRKYCNEKV